MEYSTTYSFTDFQPMLSVELAPHDQSIEFDLQPLVEARYLRITLIENYGGDAMECGRIEVIGKITETERDYPMDLTNFASSQNGGSVSTKPSAYDEYHWGALHLIDGSPGRSWSSPIGTTTETATIRLAAPTKVQFITVNPYSPSDSINWATRAAISVANSGGSFYDVGTIDLTAVGQEHVLRLNEAVDASLVRVELTSSQDASAVECSEVKVYGPTSPETEVQIDEVSLLDGN
ncbi:F5/8 type C domain protein [Rosistilla carotiformis]|uniref:F5/8 type C domain protein n=1 Tax=Rosistilla carotiformis TaxID=2528017 RepID=A0A518JTS6_9BACT|nr:discoidin domain-containing protein [Rosistilla carotiformis]QDV68961.1 F5/8 type C domain protein [Rosistilla carotiformis]